MVFSVLSAGMSVCFLAVEGYREGVSRNGTILRRQEMEIPTSEWTQHFWITDNGIKAIQAGRSITLLDTNAVPFAVVVPIDKYKKED